MPDLFSSTPIVVKGQYKGPGKATITLSGKTGEGNFQRKIDVQFPGDEPKNEVLAPIWARAKVDDLMNADLADVQRGQPDPARKEEDHRPRPPLPIAHAVHQFRGRRGTNHNRRRPGQDRRCAR